MTMNALKKSMTLVLFSVISLSAAAADEETRFSIGYDYTSGYYGETTKTSIRSIPVTINQISGRWSLKLSIPFVTVSGDGTVLPGSFGGRFNRTATTTSTTSGIGDTMLSAGYAFFPGNSFLEISAKAKIATADASKNLGTGKNDYYLQLDGVLGNGGFSPFFTLGYVVTGDTSTTTYKDVPYGSAGFMLKTSAQSSTGISYDYKKSISDGIEDQRSVSAFVTFNNSHNASTTLSLLKGLSNSSPDLGINVTFSHKY